MIMLTLSVYSFARLQSCLRGQNPGLTTRNQCKYAGGWRTKIPSEESFEPITMSPYSRNPARTRKHQDGTAQPSIELNPNERRCASRGSFQHVHNPKRIRMHLIGQRTSMTRTSPKGENLGLT